MHHVMVDLETMGTRAGCAIASIGAVKFDPDKDPAGLGLSLPQNRFHAIVELQSCINLRLHIDASTLYWWLDRTTIARNGIIGGRGGETRIHVTDALKAFTAFFGDAKYLWGHGASFDQPILEAAYHAAKLKAPCPFWNHRDTRTIFDLAGGIKPERDPAQHHHALYDSEVQAVAVLKAYEKLKGKK